MILRLVRFRLIDSRIPMVSLFAAMSLLFVGDEYWATALVGALPLFACVLIVHHLHVRVTPFEMSLPVLAPSVLGARLVSLLAPVLLPLIIWMVATWLRAEDLARLWMPIEAALVVTIALVLPNLIAARRVERPSFLKVASSWAVLAAVAAVGHLLLSVAWMVAILAVCAVASISVMFLSAPRSYVALADATSGPRIDASTPPSRPRAWFLDLIRYTGNVNTIFFNVLLIPLAALGTSQMLWVVVVVGSAEGLRTQQRWMAELPFSIRQRFLAVAIPSVVLCTACVGLGRLIALPFLSEFRAMGVNAPRPLDSWNEHESESSVPLAYWQRASSPGAMTIVAPWGERAPAYHIRVLGATFVNPYSVVAASSERFVSWQFARATTAVYGQPISRADYRANRADLPRRTTGAGVMVLLQGGLLLTFGFLILWSIELGRWHRKHTRRIYSALPVIPFITITAVVGVDVMYRNAGSGVAVSLIQQQLLHLTGLFPASSVPRIMLGLALAVSVVLAAYRLAEWQFRRAELPKPGGW